ncbi:MAG: hypothetical protein PHS48_06465 [Bacteroidales bacterium]|nr:hypothetical protein [Bacteroidales bacterium]
MLNIRSIDRTEAQSGAVGLKKTYAEYQINRQNRGTVRSRSTLYRTEAHYVKQAQSVNSE